MDHRLYLDRVVVRGRAVFSDLHSMMYDLVASYLESMQPMVEILEEKRGGGE